MRILRMCMFECQNPAQRQKCSLALFATERSVRGERFKCKQIEERMWEREKHRSATALLSRIVKTWPDHRTFWSCHCVVHSAIELFFFYSLTVTASPGRRVLEDSAKFFMLSRKIHPSCWPLVHMIRGVKPHDLFPFQRVMVQYTPQQAAPHIGAQT